MINKTLGLIVIAGFSLLFGVGAAVALITSNQTSEHVDPESYKRPVVASPKPDSDELRVRVWKVGETPPDLVEGQTDDGKRGFLYAYDLANPPAPDEKGNIVIPVYDRNGKTKVGLFTAGTAHEQDEGS